MKPLKLTLSGWGPYKGLEVADFEALDSAPLFLVTGPTGGGKTTVFDGITFALYGEVSGSIRERDSLRSDFAKAGTPTYAKLEFLHRQKRYEVLRSPRFERAKLRGEGVIVENETAQLCGEEGLMATGREQVTEAIERLMGLNYSQFRQISMIAQGEFQQLLVSSSKERTKIFRDIFHTRIYDEIARRLSEKTKALKERVEGKHQRMNELFEGLLMDSDVFYGAMERKSRNYGKLKQIADEELIQLGIRLKDEEKLLEEQEKLCRKLTMQTEQARNLNLQLEKYREDQVKLEQLKAEKDLLTKQQAKHKRALEKLPGLQEQAEIHKKALHDIGEHKRLLVTWIEKSRELQDAQADYLRAERDANLKKQEYEIQDGRRRRAAAGILAQNLQEDKPCPVCGSICHPSPAALQEAVVDEKHLELLKRAYESAWGKAMDAQNRAVTRVGALEAVTQGLEEVFHQGAEEEKAKELLRNMETDMASGSLEIKRLEEEIQAIRDGFQAAQLRMERTRTSYAHLKAEMKRPAIEEPVDMEAGAERLRLEEQTRRGIAGEKEVLYARQQNNKKNLKAIESYLKEKEVLEREYGILRDVERAANGYNQKNLVLEQYVLSVYFEEILDAANDRLRGMTGGRFELFRLPQTRDRRTKEGMELEVLDQYTGRKRSVKTLSGGESFKAALALALGTSDVVQSYAGGIQVETLFVDEGFGALDHESLGQALKILTDLGDGNRMIGIISHVEELKERIDHQIVIEKTVEGSRICC